MLSCIVLAAGESHRFGDSPKALALINGKTAIRSLIDKLLKTSLEEIIVVLGARADQIVPHLPTDPRVRRTLNPDYKEGQTSSLKKGLGELRPETSAFLFLPVDLPLLKTETVDSLINAYAQKKPRILIPVFEEKNGHPPIFCADLIKEFVALDNNQPLYTIQRRHADDILKIPVSDPGAVLSFNTPQELEKILKEPTGNS